VSHSVTVAQAQADVEFLGDFGGLVATDGRHTPTEIRRQLNLSEQSLRSLITSLGYPFFIESQAPANLPVTAAVAGEEYAEINWPSGADEVHAIHVNAPGTGGRFLPIESIDWGSRRVHARCGPPVWCLRKLPHATGAAMTDGKIQILPIPTGGQYVIDYIPAYTFVSGDSDVFVGLPDWHRWRVLDAIVGVLGIRDGDSEGRAQWAAQEREKVEQRIRAGAPKPRSGPRALPRRVARGR
jgi:hypothetical protein